MFIHRTAAPGLAALIVLAGSPGQAVQAGDELSFTLHRGFLILVQGRIAHLDGLTFILDTGTARTVVDARIARRLKLAGRRSDVLTFKGSVPAEAVVVPSIGIGPLRAEAAQILATDLSGLAGAHGVSADGILGTDALRGACLTIDYRARRIAFEPGGAWEADLPFDRESPYLVVRAQVDGVPFRLAVDTASEALVLFERAIPLAWIPRLQHRSQASDLAGPLTLRAMSADRVGLGPTMWRDRPVFVLPGAGPAPGFYDGVLGPRALGLSEVQFDLDRMVLRWREPRE